jgi:hypothetical protein
MLEALALPGERPLRFLCLYTTIFRNDPGGEVLCQLVAVRVVGPGAVEPLILRRDVGVRRSRRQPVQVVVAVKLVAHHRPFLGMVTRRPAWINSNRQS